MKIRVNQRLEIVKQILEGKKTLAEIGLQYGVTHEWVRQIGNKFNTNRTDLNKVRIERIVTAMKAGLLENKSIEELSKQLKVSVTCLARYYQDETGTSYHDDAVARRNKLIVEKYVGGKSAKKIVEKVSRILDTPKRITTTNMIYKIVANHNAKRYPNIGDKSKGGTFLDKKVLKIITKQYMNQKSPTEIAEYLNENGFKTPTEKSFTAANVYAYILKCKHGKIIA